jgi:hypothetical protein
MLDPLVAVRFDRRASTGKSKPCLLACEDTDHAEAELIAKMSAGCERGVEALVAESISAVLATDLGLPVPTPYLVTMGPQFIQSIVDGEIAKIARASSPIAFGSRKLPPGFTTWPRGRRIPRALIQTAAEIFAFDALIQNSDRRPENPNCLVKGSKLAIFDHELAFANRLIIGWQPPWKVGALQFMANPNAHLFFSGLRGQSIEFDSFEAAWQLISDQKLAKYEQALPSQWAASAAADALSLVSQIRDNIATCLAEVRRVLG